MPVCSMWALTGMGRFRGWCRGCRAGQAASALGGQGGELAWRCAVEPGPPEGQIGIDPGIAREFAWFIHPWLPSGVINTGGRGNRLATGNWESSVRPHEGDVAEFFSFR
jgi:hypothetical protein